MKLEVHCPPPVIVCTPGWIAAVAAGAQAEAVLGPAAATIKAATAARVNLNRRVILEYPLSVVGTENPLTGVLPNFGEPNTPPATLRFGSGAVAILAQFAAVAQLARASA